VAIDRQDARILVVDDDRELANVLVESLSNLGYSAAAAYSGREGLSRFENGAFQLVITDLKIIRQDLQDEQDNWVFSRGSPWL